MGIGVVPKHNYNIQILCFSSTSHLKKKSTQTTHLYGCTIILNKLFQHVSEVGFFFGQQVDFLKRTVKFDLIIYNFQKS